MRVVLVAAVLAVCASYAAAQAALVTLQDSSIPVTASDIQQGATNAPIYGFSLTRVGGTGVVTIDALDFSQLGSATTSDFTAMYLYSVPFTGTPTLLDTITTTPFSFSGFNVSLTAGSPHNFTILVDVPVAATVGNQFQCQVTNAGVTVTGATVSPATVTGQVHTIVAPSGAQMQVRDSLSNAIASGTTYDMAAAQGDTPVAGQTYTFEILSTGSVNLDLTGATPVVVTAGGNCSVSVTQQPASVSIPPTTSVTFDVLVDPTNPGTFSFNVVIQNNSTTNPYVFAVDGNAVAPGTATQLVITTQPGGGTGGVAWPQQPVVQAQDAGGNLINTFSGTIDVTITTNPGTGNLSGTTSFATTNGEWSFTDLSIDEAGTGYRLTFTCTGLSDAVSDLFNITVGPAAQLAITTQPGNGTGGLPLSTAPVVQVQDAGGNALTSDAGRTITAAILTGPGQIVAGGTANTSGGSATFSALAVDLAGTYTLEFTATSLTGATSGSFDITVGPAAALMIVTQPGGAAAGQPFNTQPVVHVVDAGGNLRTGDNATLVDASLIGGTGGAVLGGTTQVQASGGVVTFTDLEVDLPGAGYQLEFVDSVASLAVVTSAAFGVSGTATQLAVVTQPGGAVAGASFVTQPVVEIRDALGSVVASDNTTVVSVTLVAGTGNLGGTLTATASAGVATFTNLSIDTAGAGFQLEFTSTPTLTTVQSVVFSVAGVAAQLAIVQQPGGAAPGVAFTQQPVIEVRDAAGVLVATDNATQVTVSITVGTGDASAVLSGTATVTAVDGVVTFAGLSIDLAGSGYTLDFDDGGALTDVTSAAFNVTAPGTGGGGGGKDSDSCSTTDGGNQSLLWLLLACGIIGASRLRRGRA